MQQSVASGCLIWWRNMPLQGLQQSAALCFSLPEFNLKLNSLSERTSTMPSSLFMGALMTGLIAASAGSALASPNASNGCCGACGGKCSSSPPPTAVSPWLDANGCSGACNGKCAGACNSDPKPPTDKASYLD